MNQPIRPSETREELIRDAYAACNQRDLGRLISTLHSNVEWESLWSGLRTCYRRESLDAYLQMLNQCSIYRDLKEVTHVAVHAVARNVGRGTTHDGSVKLSGTGFEIFDFAGGLICRCTPYGSRKEVLDALGLDRSARQGMLVVNDDEDDRLYHFGIDPGAEMTWARYADLGRSDHDHCEMCWEKFSSDGSCKQEGYATTDGSNWLCPDCFDEVEDHFHLLLVD